MRKFFIFISITIFITLTFFYYKQTKAKPVEFTISFEPSEVTDNIEILSLMVPDDNYDEFFAEQIGDENWKTAKELFRKQAGLVKFMSDDVFTVKFLEGRVRSFALHHYEGSFTGKKIVFSKEGSDFVKTEKPLALEVKTMVQSFQVETTFEKDYPQFYEIVRKRLLWDGWMLDEMKPGDTASFIIKGIFDKDILKKMYGIMGFSINSEELGNFALVAYRNYRYGDYFSPDREHLISPPGFFRTPIDYARISSFFGFRIDPFTHRKKKHSGVDLIARKNTEIRAAADGKVIFTGRKGGYGKTIIIDHGNNIKTLYGHLNSITVSSGDNVKMGEYIGGVGNTGRSTSNHLHFEVRENDKPVNPLSFTYERNWTPPSDIADEFRIKSLESYQALLKSSSRQQNYQIQEVIVSADKNHKS